MEHVGSPSPSVPPEFTLIQYPFINQYRGSPILINKRVLKKAKFWRRGRRFHSTSLCIERILINERVLIKAKPDVLLTSFPSKMGGGKQILFLARAPTRGHPFFGSLLEPSGINRSPLKQWGLLKPSGGRFINPRWGIAAHWRNYTYSC